MAWLERWQRLLMWQRMAVMVALMAVGWAIAILVGAPLGLVLVLGAAAYLIAVIRRLQNASIDRERARQRGRWR